MTGIVTLTALVFFIAPWAVINLLAQIFLAFERRYASRRRAVSHSAIASSGPVFGILLALVELSGRYDASNRNTIIAMMLCLLLLSCLPMALHRFQRYD